MTWQASEWAWAQDVTGGTKLVLLALAERADRFGVTFVGQKHAGEMTGLSPRAVVDNLKRLEEAGLIARFRRTRSNGSRTSDWTVLAPAADRGPMADYPDEGLAPHEAVMLARSLTADSAGDDSAGPNLQKRGGPEPTVEPTVGNGSARDARGVDPVGAVWEHYRRVFPRKRGKLDATNRRIITTALEVAEVEECCRAIDGLAKSEYHVGGGFTGIEYALRGGGRNPVPASTIDRMIAMVDGPGSRGKVSGHKTERSDWDDQQEAFLAAQAEEQERESGRLSALEAELGRRPTPDEIIDAGVFKGAKR